jgi:CIC family chloride channel protein
MPDRFRRLIRLVLLAQAIGGGVALGIWLYSHEIALVNGVRLQLAAALPRPLVLPLMGLLGGAVAGALISGVEPAARGSGIVQVLLYLRGLPIPMGMRVAAVKLLASGIAIGSGLPVGPEGPSIQIGASIAHDSARLITGGRQRRLAVAIGSGAGLAAVFHAPLGGLAYILEELLGRADLRINAIATFATFVAVAWTRLLGDHGTGSVLMRNLHPITSFPTAINELRLVDVPILVALGVVAALLAVVYQRGILRLRQWMAARRLAAWQLLPVVGLLIGLGWSLLPASFDDPDKLDFAALMGMNGSGQALLALGVQGVGTAIAVAAEAPGGFLAPALVVGASLGALVQQLCETLLHYAPSTLLFAGGGAFLAALTRTPLTAILLTYELSKDYALLLPIGFAALTAIAVADLMERSTFFQTLESEALEEAAKAGH